MKKFAFLLLAFTMLFSGCSSTNGSTRERTTDSFGNTVYESEGSRTVMIHSLPYDLKYNDYNIPIIDVSFYENEVDYEYTLFIVTTLDVSSLTDADIKWLREEDLDVDAYITSEKNEIDFKSASMLGSLLLTDSKELIIVHTSPFTLESRYSFEGSKVSVTLTATQEETYERKKDDGSKLTLHKSEEVDYSTTIDNSIPDTDNIDDLLADYITKWLYNKAS